MHPLCLPSPLPFYFITFRSGQLPLPFLICPTLSHPKELSINPLNPAVIPFSPPLVRAARASHPSARLPLVDVPLWIFFCFCLNELKSDLTAAVCMYSSGL
ncbi:hypothetical protein Pst134EA_027851 [Puccinia striiformis f. sp. tritici]|uniref:hypothetical protein n=1 Tax=Puccinia striiformis f. sp. tritici TaxID=168172 RepID=UPI002008CB61|nr:hypothetical protein Pst134EA_027851 [Puccinia striiformis f. sp. tritici]KAH9448541.1 hypothetical protein Pst134EA_027851 [Puccinia striiformis f. sp. tritici]